MKNRVDNHIQCVVHGLVVYKTKVLVYSVEDQIRKKTFFRLIGGHIDFGEEASDALIREFKEEINEDIKIVEQLDVFENLFFYKEGKQHEFVSLFKIEFCNKKMYSKKDIIGNEGPDRCYKANWISIDEFKNKNKVLYPPNIVRYL